MSSKSANRLIHASSPYLLQHAYNPVDWYPWSEEAFEKARSENKLLLVSIGYSSCHWCHVMEHESFEDEEVAEIMNTHFVSIKVDREERPDVDQIYMDAVQLITGRGGWPLNMFVLPDKRPLHGGTYFPKESWKETLLALAHFYRHKQDEAEAFATDLSNNLRRRDLLPPLKENGTFSKAVLEKQVNLFKANLDTVYGGYAWAPKFPLPNNHLFLLHYALLSKDEALLQDTHRTLLRMAEGGIYDQAGGGFARYATDARWKVPHFEKMLYDNGQLLSLYAEAYRQHKNPLYAHVIQQTVQWLDREMTHAEGAFFSAQDADSEGVEGKYYVWTRDELKEVLGEDELFFSMYYNVQAEGNWEHGVNILYKTMGDEEAEALGRKNPAEMRQWLNSCFVRLLTAREQRVKPLLDDKVITAWNALMIKGLADAAQALDEPGLLQRAERNAAFLWQHMQASQRLQRIWKNGQSSVPAFAEDYAMLTEALLKLYESTFNDTYLQQAEQLMEQCISLFYDHDRQAFAFSAHDAELLIARRYDLSDDVIPSSGSVLAKCLFYLSFHLENKTYRTMAEQMLQRVQDGMKEHFISYSNWLDLLLHVTFPFRQVVITGPAAEAARREIQQQPLSNVLFAGAQQAHEERPLLKQRVKEQTWFYLCEEGSCSLPQSDVQTFIHELIAS